MKQKSIKYHIALVSVAALIVLPLSGCVTTGTTAPKAIESLTQKADNGDADAQYRLGLRYTNGSGVEQNYQTATAWFDKAADANHAGAQYMAAVNYSTGRGAAENRSKAVRLYTKAANQGHARSQYQLATAYANGLGTEKDLAWAARLYGKSARQGHASAMFSLGVFWATGRGLPADSVRGLSWIELAVSNGDKQAPAVRDKLAARMNNHDKEKSRKITRQWKVSTSAPFDDTPTILYVQHSLRLLKRYYGKVDGIVGPITNKAIREYSQNASIGTSTQINETLVNSLRKAIMVPKKLGS